MSEKKTLFAVDIGNTNIVIGVFKNGRILKRLHLNTHLKSGEIFRQMSKDLKSAGLDIRSAESALISSVVPDVSRILEGLFKRRFGIKVLLLGRDIKVPIKNLYKNPNQVGQDRLVNAYACLRLYGKPAIIVDFGTATTFDYLDKNGAYRGGLITPGAEISLDALAERTALLPKIRLKKPKSLIGRDTVNSMRSGVVYGLSAMCDGLVDKIKKNYPRKTVVVATGGLSPFFAPYCKDIDYVDKDITLKGIYLTYKKILKIFP